MRVVVRRIGLLSLLAYAADSVGNTAVLAPFPAAAPRPSREMGTLWPLHLLGVVSAVLALATAWAAVTDRDRRLAPAGAALIVLDLAGYLMASDALRSAHPSLIVPWADPVALLWPVVSALLVVSSGGRRDMKDGGHTRTGPVVWPQGWVRLVTVPAAVTIMTLVVVHVLFRFPDELAFVLVLVAGPLCESIARARRLGGEPLRIGGTATVILFVAWGYLTAFWQAPLSVAPGLYAAALAPVGWSVALVAAPTVCGFRLTGQPHGGPTADPAVGLAASPTATAAPRPGVRPSGGASELAR